MYSTCLFCHADLGTNGVVEAFPIGRRLAFDAARGRLWVVCRRCERWNLTPMDERWEAVEQCERRFTSTRLRVSTSNIGLCRLPEGLELVRIGSPQRPEMAAWRYGDQFGRRRRRYIGMSAAAGIAGITLVVAGPTTGLVAGGTWGLIQLASAVHGLVRDRLVRTRLAVPGREKPTILRGKDMKRVVLRSVDRQWMLRVPYVTGLLDESDSVSDVTLTGDDALRAASSILPAVNVRGAKRDQVSDAVRLLEETPDPDRLFSNAAIDGLYPGLSKDTHHLEALARTRRGSEIFLDRLPRTLTLALEMAAHEDIERRAMLGELALLEQAWRDADEVAAIADSLLLPESVDQQLEAIKKKST